MNNEIPEDTFGYLELYAFMRGKEPEEVLDECRNAMAKIPVEVIYKNSEGE